MKRKINKTEDSLHRDQVTASSTAVAPSSSEEKLLDLIATVFVKYIMEKASTTSKDPCVQLAEPHDPSPYKQ